MEQYRTVIQSRAVYEISRVARGFTARSFCRSLMKSRKLLRAAIAAGDVSYLFILNKFQLLNIVLLHTDIY